MVDVNEEIEGRSEDGSYQRQTPFRADENVTEGVVSGTIATDGEASDGHILDIEGGRVDPPRPMLFGHDDVSGRGNLGSWLSLRKEGLDKKPGKGRRMVRGTGMIETGGPMAEFRQDVAYMAAKGHLSGLSIRWDAAGDPIRRDSLPTDHYAHQKRSDSFLGGLFFPKWKMLEASIVTLPADQGALIGRALDMGVDANVREQWVRELQAEGVEIPEPDVGASGLILDPEIGGCLESEPCPICSDTRSRVFHDESGCDFFERFQKLVASSGASAHGGATSVAVDASQSPTTEAASTERDVIPSSELFDRVARATGRTDTAQLLSRIARIVARKGEERRRRQFKRWMYDELGTVVRGDQK